MTTALERTPVRGGSPAELVGAAAPAGSSSPGGGWLARNPAWPVVALLGGWPVWWATGIGDYAPVVVAIPMVWRMYKWRARHERKIRMPPGFALYVLFLVVSLAGAATLSATAPQTMPGPVSTRLISWGLREASYISYAVLLLYVGNLTERELSRRRLAWQLGLVGIYSIACGLIAMVLPKLQFTSPLAPLVPNSLQKASQGMLFAMLHPSMTQIQVFMGLGRVTAPFLYANTWGNNVAILLPWLLVAWYSYGKRWQRRATVAIMFASIAPILFSFDRGLWIAILFAVGYLAVRFAAQGRKTLLGVVCGALIITAIVYFVTPIHTLVSQRVANATSNSARASLSVLSAKDSLASPIIGFGDTRREWGSVKSIAVGRTAKCSSCGQRSAGSNGQLWLLLISTGIVGTVLYLGFFGYGIWRYRHDTSPYGLTGVLVLLLGFVFMFVYDAVGATLAFTVLAYGLLWRNDRDSRAEWAQTAAAGPSSAGPGVLGSAEAGEAVRPSLASGTPA